MVHALHDVKKAPRSQLGEVTAGLHTPGWLTCVFELCVASVRRRNSQNNASSAGLKGASLGACCRLSAVEPIVVEIGDIIASPPTDKQLLRICDWGVGVGGSFVALLPAINEPRSGRAECAGMGSRRKQSNLKKERSFEDSLPINQIDWRGSQRRVLSPRLMSEVVKKIKLHIAPHSLGRLCAASAPRPRLSRDLNRETECVCMCVNEQFTAHFTMSDDEHG